MAKTFREWNLDQTMMFPPSLRDLVPEGHLAHFVRDTTVEALDLSAILEEYGEERGYPPYHPAMMTALLLYAYSQGLYSSRRIMRGCEERVDFMVVTGMQKPDFRTISEFRKRHLTALGGLFGQVLLLCQKQGLVKLGHVALDSTRIKANASKHKAMSYGRMKKAEPELAAVVKQWLEKAEAIDAREDEEFGADRRGDELPDWVKSKQKRLEKIREAKAALEAEAQAAAQEAPGRKRPPKGPPGVPDDTSQRNFTDPESRIMKGPDGFVQAYSGHIAVDAQSHVVVAQTLTNNAADVTQLAPIVAQIKTNTGKQARELSADAGYCSEANLKELNRRHIQGYVATGRYKRIEGGPVIRHDPKRGTRVHAMHLRLRRAGHRSRYRLRKQVAEPVIGQLKHGRGLRQFLLRGLVKVSGEWSLICTAHNLLKLAAAVR